MELTNVLDVLKDADGAAAQGKLVVHNPAFIAADGTAVVAGALTYRIPSSTPGLIDLMLAPTEDSNPPEARYTVEYFLRSGASYSETWNIPRTGPVSISQARTP
jgi:hypothetical protein